MSRTEYDPIATRDDVPHVHDTPIPPPASASADSEQQHALAVQARAVAQAAPEVRVARVEAARRALPGRDPHAGRAGLGGEAP